jgi:nucleotide-binding universal stress UspA family protein
MSQEEYQHSIRRILVALDASPASLTALETAAELATALGAELLGLFVEDINLIRLATLSFSHEVGLFSGTRRQVNSVSIERQLRAQAGRARHALVSISERSQVSWSFRVARGAVAAELLAAAIDADLVVLGKTGGAALGRRRQLGSTARAVLGQTSRLTLLLQAGSRLALPVLVIYDGSTVARKALAATAQLLQGRTDGHITVLIVTGEADRAPELQQAAAAQLAARGLEARYIWHSELSAQRLVHMAQTEGCRLLVIPSDGSSLDQDTILTLLGQVDCPVLLVR